ncbi:AI-2E family transporter [Liquorilactobacillus oeni]|nr:AI-2E family transporter [Liquorilactobacillus oeni]
MLEKLKKSKMMYFTVEALLIATLIWVCTKISFVFEPVGTFISTLFIPVIISGFLYYLFRPVVAFFMKLHIGRFRINRALAVVLVFVILIGIIALALTFMVPLLISQVGQLILNTPDYLSILQKSVNHLYNDLSDHEWMRQLNVQDYVDKIGKNFMNSVAEFLGSLTKSLGTVIGMITSITVTIITVPFMLFYMLKDGHRLIPNIQKLMPTKRAEQVEELLSKMGDTISKYIAGQVIECTFVATFTSLGYWIIGMPYALLLGVLAGTTNIIPYLGPYLGLLPALILAFSVSFKMVIFVVIVCVIVQQVDGNLIYPNVIGKSLDIHPLTIIMLLLVAGNLAGLMGMILGIPFYAVLKVIVKYFRDIYLLNNEKSK